MQKCVCSTYMVETSIRFSSHGRQYATHTYTVRYNEHLHFWRWGPASILTYLMGNNKSMQWRNDNIGLPRHSSNTARTLDSREEKEEQQFWRKATAFLPVASSLQTPRNISIPDAQIGKKWARCAGQIIQRLTEQIITIWLYWWNTQKRRHGTQAARERCGIVGRRHQQTREIGKLITLLSFTIPGLATS